MLSEEMGCPVWSLWRYNIKSGGGSGVGVCFACGLASRNCDNLFLDSMSALELFAPAICSVTMWISKVAAKNHKDLSKCITVLSLEEPFVIASTRLRF